MRSINPTNGELIADYPEDSNDQLDYKLTMAHEALYEWPQMPIEKRAQLLRNAASELQSGIGPYSRRITDEMGKVISQSRSEIEKCAWVCDYFAEHGARFLEHDQLDTKAYKSYVAFEPLGTILAIMPWNFPFWQVFRFAVPTLLAGNTVVVKHAPNVHGCAHAIEEVFQSAGFPPGVFTNLYVPEKRVESIIRDHRIAGVTLTGSVGAGRAVGAIAGEEIKKCVLELGGSDPFIVLEDCDIDEAVRQGVFARTIANGQSCIAAKRFIVEKPIYEEFVRKFRDKMASLIVGDPSDEATDIGPLARKDLRDSLHRQVRKTVKRGAECLLGGEIPDGPGYYYPPTLLVDVDEHMTAFEEEVFGPVASVTLAEDADHAIELANRSPYGLGASLWTRKERAEQFIPRIQAGAIAVNDIVKSDPRFPFGGIKKSGIGRELSRYGMMEFVNIKTVWIR